MADSSYGVVRRNAIPDYNDGSTSQMAITSRGDTLVANSLPFATEYVRLDSTWTCQIATGSAFTNVANMPTTLAEFVLYNGESSTGKSYIINSIWWLSLTSLTAASGVTIIYQVGAPAAPTDDTAQLINSPLGSTYGGSAKRSVSDTSMTANKWAAVAATPAGAAASIGLGVVADINGGIILKPGFSLGLNAVAGTAAGTSLMGVCWSELFLPEA